MRLYNYYGPLLVVDGVVTTELAKELASSVWDEVTIGLNLVPGLRPETESEMLEPGVGVCVLDVWTWVEVGPVGGTGCGTGCRRPVEGPG